MVKTKICSTCKIEKHSSEFHRHNSNSSGIQSVCKVCRSEYKKTTEARAIEYQRKYGISLDVYESMLEAIGMLGDDPEVLTSAIEYLNTYQTVKE